MITQVDFLIESRTIQIIQHQPRPYKTYNLYARPSGPMVFGRPSKINYPEEVTWKCLQPGEIFTIMLSTESNSLALVLPSMSQKIITIWRLISRIFKNKRKIKIKLTKVLVTKTFRQSCTDYQQHVHYHLMYLNYCVLLQRRNLIVMQPDWFEAIPNHMFLLVRIPSLL